MARTINWSSALLSRNIGRRGCFRRIHMYSVCRSDCRILCEAGDQEAASGTQPRLKAKYDVLEGQDWLRARGLALRSSCVGPWRGMPMYSDRLAA